MAIASTKSRERKNRLRRDEKPQANAARSAVKVVEQAGGAEVASGDAERNARASFQQAVRRLDWSLIGIILGIKTLVFVFGAASYQALTNKAVGGAHGWLEIWNRWDALHYQSLARDGYQGTGEARFSLVFYPLYPWLVRVFALLTRDYIVSAVIVSGLASIVAGIMLQRLVEFDDSRENARRAVLFLFIFPTSYFLHIGYTESLFLALTLGCFVAARREQWMAAGLLGALASLTRINGMILIPALAVEAFGHYRVTRRWRWQWLWIGAIALGCGGYLLLNLHVTGNALSFMKFQREHWFKTLAPPWSGLREIVNSIAWRAPSEAQMTGVQELFFVLLGAVCTVLCWLKLRPAYGVWIMLNLLLVTSTSFILSVPRYTLIMFPIFILFAKCAARRLCDVVLTVWSLLFLALFASLFVQGRWAF